jgi:hypothetical protein
VKSITPRGGVETGSPRGYRGRVPVAEQEPNTGERHSHKRTSSPSASIFLVPRGGAGAATYVTLGGRSLRRAYAQARSTSGVRQEGLSPRNHLKDTESSKDWPSHLGVTKGGGYGP